MENTLVTLQVSLIFGLILIAFILALGGIGFRKKPSSEYLYHVTTQENARKIVQNGSATIYPTSGWKSYSNWLRPSTFYFAGFPSLLQVWFNIPGYAFGTDLVAVRIEVRNLPDAIDTKSRFVDRAVFHTGPLLGVPAEIVSIPKERIRFVLEPLLLLLTLLFLSTAVLFFTAFIG